MKEQDCSDHRRTNYICLAIGLGKQLMQQQCQDHFESLVYSTIHQSSIGGGLLKLGAGLFRPLTWSQRKFDPLKSCHVGPDLLMITNESSII